MKRLKMKYGGANCVRVCVLVFIQWGRLRYRLKWFTWRVEKCHNKHFKLLNKKTTHCSSLKTKLVTFIVHCFHFASHSRVSPSLPLSLSPSSSWSACVPVVSMFYIYIILPCFTFFICFQCTVGWCCCRHHRKMSSSSLPLQLSTRSPSICDRLQHLM